MRKKAIVTVLVAAAILVISGCEKIFPPAAPDISKHSEKMMPVGKEWNFFENEPPLPPNGSMFFTRLDTLDFVNSDTFYTIHHYQLWWNEKNALFSGDSLYVINGFLFIKDFNSIKKKEIKTYYFYSPDKNGVAPQYYWHVGVGNGNWVEWNYLNPEKKNQIKKKVEALLK